MKILIFCDFWKINLLMHKKIKSTISNVSVLLQAKNLNIYYASKLIIKHRKEKFFKKLKLMLINIEI